MKFKENSMAAVPMYPGQTPRQQSLPGMSSKTAPEDWTKYVAAGALLAGGAMMIAGNRRAGLVVAAAGTALAMLEEQEMIESWWNRIPGYLRDAQDLLDKVEGYIEEVSAQGHKLQGMLQR
jgi:hypothetical protein